MKKNKNLILITILVVIVGVLTVYLVRNNSTSSLNRICPDEWVDDRMPTVGNGSEVRQYFIINGQRKELKDYDVNWIKSHCSVKVQTVY